MFERFTDRARQAIVLAQDEARALTHDYLGTEHLLLGLLRDEDGLAARTLVSLGVSLEEMRAHVARIVGHGTYDEATGQIPFTPRAKKVLALSLREAHALGHDWIGTEHLLLGLVREQEGVAMRVLLEDGLDAETIRSTLLGLLSGDEAPAPRRRPRPAVRSGSYARVVPPRRARDAMLLAAFALGAVTFGIGILIGWAIWGA